MILLNEQVRHKSFGEGHIVEYSDSSVKVRFPSGDKRFVFPDAFGTYITLVDKKTAKQVDGLKREVEKERRKRELELAKVRAIEHEKQQRLLEQERLMKNHKLSPVSQVAFWCEEQELDQVFEEWRVFTGLRKSGPNKGKPNRLIRLHQNSAVLITVREPGTPEKDRRIVGVFMVEEGFIGRICEDGYIPAHVEYKILLTKEESQKMPFWYYYLNERYPNNMTWNSGRSRYFDNVWMAQVLQGIISLKTDPEERELAQAFLEHFCQLNRLVAEDLPEPSGVLARQTEGKRGGAKEISI